VGRVNYVEYEADVRAHFHSFSGKNLGQVEATAVLGGMMNILRKHRVQIDPVFTVVNIAMLVAEGLGKQLDASLDIIQLAGPYIMESFAGAPEGRMPRRKAPSLSPSN
jgi:predicted unusual protein kinase regulating ubiquinone biosynthesis (AarF/ABC1/UbiB family)